MKSPLLFTATTLVYILASFTAPGQEANKKFSGITKIDLATSSGNCKVVKGSSKDVEVNVTYTYPQDRYTPEMEQRGSTLRLKEDFHGGGSFSGQSSWTLTIPENLEIRFSSGSGNFDANDISLTLSANTGSGEYQLKGVSGDSRINTGSGDITIDNQKGAISLNTGSGDIEIMKAEGDVDANTGSGRVRMAYVAGAVVVNVGSGDITASDMNLKGKSRFSSGSGDANITLGAALQYDLSVNSGSGDALVNFNGNKIEGKVVMIASKKHGNIIAPFPFDKTEELNDDGNDNVRIRKTAQLGSMDVEINIGTGSGTAEIRK